MCPDTSSMSHSKWCKSFTNNCRILVNFTQNSGRKIPPEHEGYRHTAKGSQRGCQLSPSGEWILECWWSLRKAFVFSLSINHTSSIDSQWRSIKCLGRETRRMAGSIKTQLPQTHLTFLSRLPVMKYLLSGVQSQVQMMRLCPGVLWSVEATRLKTGPGMRDKRNSFSILSENGAVKKEQITSRSNAGQLRSTIPILCILPSLPVVRTMTEGEYLPPSIGQNLRHCWSAHQVIQFELLPSGVFWFLPYTQSRH